MKAILFSVFALLIMASLVLALPKPLQQSFFPSDTSLEGTACTQKYSIEGAYCSVNIREFYQCLPTGSGLQWQQRSENCENYGETCVVVNSNPQCGIKDKSNLLIIILLAAIAIILVAIFLIKRRKRRRR